MILSPIPAQTSAPPRQAESAPLESETRNFDAILQQAQKPENSTSDRDSKKSESSVTARDSAPAKPEATAEKLSKSDRTQRGTRANNPHDLKDEARVQDTEDRPSTQQRDAGASSEPATSDSEESQVAPIAGEESDAEVPSGDASQPDAAEELIAQLTIATATTPEPAKHAAIAESIAAIQSTNFCETPAPEISESDASTFDSDKSDSSVTGSSAGGQSATSNVAPALSELLASLSSPSNPAVTTSEFPAKSPAPTPDFDLAASIAPATSHVTNKNASESTGPTPATNFASQLAQQLDEQSQTSANVAQVTRGLQAAIHQNGGSVTLRLSPPELGLVRVQMQLDAGVVRAELVAQQDSAASLLSKELGQLKHALESQGLTVDKLGVQTMSPSAPVSASRENNGFSSSAQDDGRSRGQMHDDRRERSSPQSWSPAEELSEFDRKLLNLVA